MKRILAPYGTQPLMLGVTHCHIRDGVRTSNSQVLDRTHTEHSRETANVRARLCPSHPAMTALPPLPDRSRASASVRNHSAAENERRGNFQMGPIESRLPVHPKL